MTGGALAFFIIAMSLLSAFIIWNAYGIVKKIIQKRKAKKNGFNTSVDTEKGEKDGRDCNSSGNC